MSYERHDRREIERHKIVLAWPIWWTSKNDKIQYKIYKWSVLDTKNIMNVKEFTFWLWKMVCDIQKIYPMDKNGTYLFKILSKYTKLKNAW